MGKLFATSHVVSFLVLLLWSTTPLVIGEKDLRPCPRTEACRVVEYHPVVNEQTGSGDDDGSGQKSSSFEVLYDDGNVGRSFSYHEKTHFTVSSREVCSCGEDLACPDENSTDAETSVKLDSFITLKLCRPKSKTLPVCRDFKRPSVRIFKESVQETPDSEPPFAKAQLWCRCSSENYPRSRYPEVWPVGQGLQVATAYRCSPFKH